MERPEWSEYFMKMALLVSERATCPKLHVGCVLVKDNRILTTGYNGSVHGTPHCTEAGCILDEDGRCIRTIHAEVNAISQAAKYAICVDGASSFVTNTPCINCLKALLSAGICNIYTCYRYKDERLVEFINNAKINITIVNIKPTNLSIDYDVNAFKSAR